MSLKEYHRKRHFNRTPEPAGKASAKRKMASAPATDLSYVIQKHDASHLHYDFRLQLGDVLKSWAVPKGPSLDPHDKRLAIEVEDHPLEYGGFEGTIPKGEYGGGTVMLWDQGSWEPVEDPEAGYRAGKLKFNLHGEKLRGSWTLIRRGAYGGRGDKGKPQWLLMKHGDDEARNNGQFDVTAAEPLSVVSGRNLKEIAAGKPAKKKGSKTLRDAVWSSNHKSNGALAPKDADDQPTNRRSTKKTAKPSGRPTAMPRDITPELATLVDRAPDGDNWFHEIKFDGYRMVCHVDGERIRFTTRNHLDWTKKLGPLVEAVRALKLDPCIFDGEIIVLDEQGVSQFQLLQNSFQQGRPGQVIYTVFDLLYFGGQDLRGLPLERRKAALKSLNLFSDRGSVRYSEHMVGEGPAFFKAAEIQGLEGIISKRRDRPYLAGRTKDWLKIKSQQHAEFVIGGFTDPEGARESFGALLLGYHDGNRLEYAGRVGTGFDHKTLQKVLSQLQPLERKQSPFTNFPARAKTLKGVHWVEPAKVAQVTFSNWTEDRQLRHPSFQGLREDKPAKAVTKEATIPLKTIADAVSGKARPNKGAPARSPKQPSPRPSPKGRGSNPQEIQIAGARLTHPDRVFWPEDNITKRELAEYYAAHAKLILPQLVGRPLSIVRCPSGTSGERFFQKHLGDTAPRELGKVQIREKSGSGVYSYVNDATGLVALAQIAALEIHPWGSRADKVEQPDRLIFDLDPAPDVEWPKVIEAAREVRDFLKELGLESFLKTSGGKGLHIVAPIQRKREWPEVEDFCERVAKSIAAAAPQRYVANMSKAKRVGKIYLDYLRNQRGSTAIMAYGTRAKPGAPISLPITWQELSRSTSGDQFHLREVTRRLAKLRRDPWEGIGSVRQSISAKAMKYLAA